MQTLELPSAGWQPCCSRALSCWCGWPDWVLRMQFAHLQGLMDQAVTRWGYHRGQRRSARRWQSTCGEPGQNCGLRSPCHPGFSHVWGSRLGSWCRLRCGQLHCGYEAHICIVAKRRIYRSHHRTTPEGVLNKCTFIQARMGRARPARVGALQSASSGTGVRDNLQQRGLSCWSSCILNFE